MPTEADRRVQGHGLRPPPRPPTSRSARTCARPPGGRCAAGLAADREVTLPDAQGFELPGDLDGDGAMDLVTTRDLFQRTGGTARIWRFPVAQEPGSRDLAIP